MSAVYGVLVQIYGVSREMVNECKYMLSFSLSCHSQQVRYLALAMIFVSAQSVLFKAPQHLLGRDSRNIVLLSRWQCVNLLGMVQKQWLVSFAQSASNPVILTNFQVWGLLMDMCCFCR